MRLRPVNRSAQALPWATAALGSLVASWDFWKTGGGPIAWVAIGTAAGMAMVLATHKLFGQAQGKAFAIKRRDSAALRLARAQIASRRLPPAGTSAAKSNESPLVGSANGAAGAPAQNGNLKSLVDAMLAEGRHALLLRPQIAENLDPHWLAIAQEALDREMSLVPDGDVLLESQGLAAAVENDPTSDVAPAGRLIHVASAYLDRTAVTNAQFQTFVLAGGYQEMGIWEEAIWPAVFDFIDTSGHPGPRFWRDGRCPEGKENHPVVGVCWYEAAAYARWIGKRLPAEAEWVKAGCWPVHLSPTNRMQRKFPWGNTLGPGRANLWGSKPGDTVGVEDFPAGESVGGVCQLIGNVWEWMAEDFVLSQDAQADGPLLKSLRGGAFDTYFDLQSTCQFATGDDPLARKHNIGFRLALGICDLVDSTAQPVERPVQTAVGRESAELEFVAESPEVCPT
jgi:iron(II)-dependent oxidoreductase